MLNERLLRLARATAVLIGFSFFEHSTMLRMAIGPLLGVQSSPEVLLLSWAWNLLTAVTIAGLALGPRWSASSLLALVHFSTILLSIPLVPVMTTVAPQQYRPIVTARGNILLLSIVPILLKSSRAPDSALVAG